jgi:hypothetical protein
MIEYLCEFVIENINLNPNMKIVGEEYSYDEFADIDRCINIIIEKLHIDKNNIEVNIENIDKNRATVISFTYNNRLCEFYELIGTQRDYLGVRLMPVS